MGFKTQANTVVGIGSPVVDLLARIDDAFLKEQVEGKKGGMELVSAQTLASIMDRLDHAPHKAPGGSAGNTIFTLARMGMPAGFIGKLGDDENGRYYREQFQASGGNASGFKVQAEEPTATSLCLVSPDAERTMRTHLGAAMALSPADISVADFKGYTHLHTEGYLLFNADLITRILACAKEAGCSVSMDLASFEVVNGTQNILPGLLDAYVDIVFANEDETAAFTGTRDPETGLACLNDYCSVCAVKLGADGALLKKGHETVKVDAVHVPDVVDTTGAGDFWAAGFLYGYLRDKDLKTCGWSGAVLGAEVVAVMGASIPDARWPVLESMLTES